MKQTVTYKQISKWIWNIRMWTRRTLWGDREFLQFEGPVTILIQSRTNRITDAFTRSNVEDVAIRETGTFAEIEGKLNNLNVINSEVNDKPRIQWTPATTKIATVVNGKVELADSDFSEFAGRKPSK